FHVTGVQTCALPILEKPVRTVGDAAVWKPKDLAPHIKPDYSVAHLHPYVNMRTLIGHHLGLKGNLEQLLADQDDRAILLNDLVNGYVTSGGLSASGMYQFFPSQSDVDYVVVYSV